MVEGGLPRVKDGFFTLRALRQPKRDSGAVSSFGGIVNKAKGHREVVGKATTRAVLMRVVVGVVGFNSDGGRIHQRAGNVRVGAIHVRSEVKISLFRVWNLNHRKVF